MATRKINGVEVTADRFVFALIDRLVAAEKRIASLEKEVQRNYGQWAESCPKLTAANTVLFRGVLADAPESEDAADVEVPVAVARKAGD